MLINPKIMMQQNKIFENKKNTVTLPYSDEFIFFKMLDQTIESGKTIRVTFPKEKITEGSGLHKRLASCSNGEEFFDQMSELAKTVFEVFIHVASKNIFGLWKISKDLTQKQLYQAYKVDYLYDERNETYFLLLEPVGEGSNNKGWTVAL